METWFSLPNLKTLGPPPRWKMAIVSFIGAYSISLLAQHILGLYLGQSPLLTNTLVLGPKNVPREMADAATIITGIGITKDLE